MKKITKADKVMTLSGICSFGGLAVMIGLCVLGLMPEGSGSPTTASESWAVAVFLSGMLTSLAGCLLFIRNVERWFVEGLIADPKDSA